MRVVQGHHQDVNYLFRVSESAAFAGDIESLTRLLLIVPKNNTAIHSYINGLIAFVEGKANYAIYFQEAVRHFLDPEGTRTPDASVNSVSFLLKNANASGRSLPEFIRGSSNIRELYIIDNLLTLEGASHKQFWSKTAVDEAVVAHSSPGNPIILISCSLGYLRVFGEYYIKTVRRRNSNNIHFHVLEDDLEAARDFMLSLKRKYVNVRYSLEMLSVNAHTYITLSRFLICRDIMTYYNSDVLISDIDLCMDYDLNLVGATIREKESDFGLFSLKYHAPWGRFAVGFSYFRVDNCASQVYLDVLSRYLTWLYANGGFFSMDMVGGMMAHQYMQERGYDFKLHDLSAFADIMEMHTKIPKKLQKGKIKVKFKNGIPE
jgi:hypothetical protein